MEDKKDNSTQTKITKTKDSFGNTLWKVEYIRCGKKTASTFYTKAEAEDFKKRGVPLLENEPFDEPRKQTRRSREVPKW
ncbi:hypothetical protein LCGC14_1573880 [marine sediment metagenome]|uniref:Uncharacterized protein n=1 Tax=marine sediment metagenome TaxID=412755 RepID=A0A0F9LJ91_9ZZZZ